MAVDYTHGSVTVGTTATLVFTSTPENDGVLISNRGPASAFIGGSTVTADDSSTGGVEIVPGEKLTVSTVGNVNGNLYAVTPFSTAVISFIHI